MYKCPYCGREFKTKRGLAIHVGRVHRSEKEEEEVLMEILGEKEGGRRPKYPDIM